MSGSRVKRQLIVAGLEPFIEGEGFDVWPPHIKLTSWFHGAQQRKLAAGLTEAALRSAPFEVRVEGTSVELCQKLDQLHGRLITDVHDAGGVIEDLRAIGYSYRPQVDMDRPLALEPTHKIGQFAVVEAAANEIFRVNQVHELG